MVDTRREPTQVVRVFSPPANSRATSAASARSRCRARYAEGVSTSATIPDLKRGLALDAPPRRVPLLLSLQVMFGRVACAMGLAFLLPVLAVPLFGTAILGGGPVPFVTFDFLAAIFIFGVAISGVRAVRLLRDGRLGWGTRSVGPFVTRSGNARARVLNYRFVDDKGHERTALTHEGSSGPLLDEAEEPLLYDDTDAILLDEIPGFPRIVDGKLAVGSRRSLVLAIVTLAFLAAGVWVTVGAALGMYGEPMAAAASLFD